MLQNAKIRAAMDDLPPASEIHTCCEEIDQSMTHFFARKTPTFLEQVS